MANDITAFVKAKYTKGVQALLEETLIAMDVANLSLRADMPDGNTINYPRPVYSNTENYTKYTSVVDADVISVNEQLTIDQTPYISFVYDEVDKLDDGYSVVDQEIQNNAFRLRQYIEGKLLAQYAFAGNGLSDTPVALTAGGSQNSVATYGKALATLRNDGVDSSNMVIIADPFSVQKIGEASLGNTYNVADEHFRRGFRGMFQGAGLYEATNLTATVSLNVATNVTADDTITIAGVTFTFKAAPSLPGEIDIGGSAAATRALIIDAINNDEDYAPAAGTAATYFEVSKVNRAKLQSITAVAGSGDAIIITSNRGYRPVSSDLTAAADKFAAVTVWNIVMQRGSIDMVLQKEVCVSDRQIPDKLATRFITWTRFGIKTFLQGAERMYALPIVAQAAE